MTPVPVFTQSLFGIFVVVEAELRYSSLNE